MLPADQRFDADHPAADNFGFRLILQDEFIAVDRFSEIVFESQAFDNAGIHCAAEELVAVASIFLGMVHRDIGILEQRVHVLAIIRVNADADAGSDIEFVTIEPVRQRNGFHDVLGDMRCLLYAANLGQQDHEFIAPLATDGIDATDIPVQLPGDLLQQFVADAMPHRVVDILEAVEVDEQDRQLRFVASGGRNRLADPVEQHGAAWQAGEEIVLGQVTGARFVFPALGNVNDLGDEMNWIALHIPHQRNGDNGPHDMAILVEVAFFHAAVRDFSGKDLTYIAKAGFNIVRMRQLKNVMPHNSFSE